MTTSLSSYKIGHWTYVKGYANTGNWCAAWYNDTPNEGAYIFLFVGEPDKYYISPPEGGVSTRDKYNIGPFPNLALAKIHYIAHFGGSL